MAKDTYDNSVVEQVIAVLADRLVLDKKEIEIDSCLIEDLGADSLDFLDIIFSLEKQFKISIRDAELNKVLKAEFKTDGLTEDGFVLRTDIDRLSDFIPKISTAADLNKITPRTVFKFITVETMVILVTKKLQSAEPVED